MAERHDGLSGLVVVLTPTLMGILGVLLLNTPIRLFEGHVPTPILPLAVVFFWTLYGTNYMPALSSFIIGLMQDFLSGGPIGVWASIYLTVQLLIHTQKTYFYGREQHVVWMGFAIATVAAGFLFWIEMSLLNRAWVPIAPLFFQLFMTILLYPVLSYLFSHLHRKVIIEH